MVSRLKNPMRFSISHRSIDFSVYAVNVDELELRPSEGQLYVHWTSPECFVCGVDGTMYNWEDDDNTLHWTCAEHTPDDADAEEYHV